MFTKINTKMTEARDEEGFTLIELLVVILIIGILAAIAIPVFLNQQKAAVKAGIKSDVHNTTLNVALSITEFPGTTGFVTYATGQTVPTLTSGQAAVRTVNTSEDVLTITNNPASGAAPSTATGNGAWNDYQVVGTNPKLPKYCFVFSSITGKYSSYDDCSIASGTDAGSGPGTGSTTSPTTPTATDVYYENFDPSVKATHPEWAISRDKGATWNFTPSFGSAVAGQTPAQQENGNTTALSYQSPGPFDSRLILPNDLEPGDYKVSLIAKDNIGGNYNWTFKSSPSAGSVSNVQAGTQTWDTYTFNFTVTTKAPVTLYFSNNRESTSVASYLDNVRVTKIS